MVPLFFICGDYMNLRIRTNISVETVTMYSSRKPKRKGKCNAYYQDSNTQRMRSRHEFL